MTKIQTQILFYINKISRFVHLEAFYSHLLKNLSYLRILSTRILCVLSFHLLYTLHRDCTV